MEGDESDDVVLSISSEEPVAHLWDLHTGTLLVSYKNELATANATALIGNDHFASAQKGKAAIHIWDWRKDQPIFKCAIPEPVTCLAATSDGYFLVAGSVSGKFYVWQVTTGVLLRTCEAHYKPVTVLRFTDDNSVLISGGEDAVCNLWFLTSLVDQAGYGRDPEAWRSWAEHSLPITDICCGSGGVNARVITASLDRTCRIWDMGTGQAVVTVVLPTVVTSVTMDVAETRVIAGGATGVIYEVDLYNPVSYDSAAPDASQLFKGHTQAVTSVAMNMDGSVLVSASNDGSVRVWDAVSRQTLKTFSSHRGAVSAVMVLPRPVDVMGTDRDRVLAPVRPLAKFPPVPGSETELGLEPTDPIVMMVERPVDDPDMPPPLTGHMGSEQVMMERIRRGLEAFLAHGSEGRADVEVAEVKEQLAAAQTTNEQWKTLNNALYSSAVDSVVRSLHKH